MTRTRKHRRAFKVALQKRTHPSPHTRPGGRTGSSKKGRTPPKARA